MPRVVRHATPARPTWLLAVLAPALILGIVAMHSMLAQSPQPMPMVMAPSASSAPHGAEVSASSAQTTADPTDGGHGHEGSMPDCGGLMAMCLALIVSIIAFVAARRGAVLRVLWQRPLPTYMHLGAARAAFEQLTPLQRTAVIRC